jgi:negative regulator of genetic competence, sporulation and motility
MSEITTTPEITIVKYAQSPAYKRAQKKYRLKNAESMRTIQKQYYEANKSKVRLRQKLAYESKKEEKKIERKEKKRIVKLNQFKEIIKMIREVSENTPMNDKTEEIYNAMKIYYK